MTCPFNARFSVLLAVVACACITTVVSAAENESSLFQLPESPVAGGKLFMEKGCVTCHAIRGLGGTGGPDLGRVQAGWSFLDIAGIMWNHQPKMEEEFKIRKTARPELNSEEMFQLIAFVYFLNYFGDPGDAAKGELVFLRKGCIECHSVGTQGPEEAVPLDRFQFHKSPAFFSAALWNASKEMTKVMVEQGIPRPVYETSDISNILAFIRRDAAPIGEEDSVYLPPGSTREGAKLFKEKGCIQCHAVRGEGGEIGPNLGSWEPSGVLSQMASAMWNHGPSMWETMAGAGDQFPVFSGKEISDIMTFLYFGSFVDLPGDPKRGDELFSEKGCVACHWGGIQVAKSAVLSVSEMELPSAPDVIAAMWNHASEMQEATDSIEVPWPRIKPGEMADLVAFINSKQ